MAALTAQEAFLNSSLLSPSPQEHVFSGVQFTAQTSANSRRGENISSPADWKRYSARIRERRKGVTTVKQSCENYVYEQIAVASMKHSQTALRKKLTFDDGQAEDRYSSSGSMSLDVDRSGCNAPLADSAANVYIVPFYVEARSAVAKSIASAALKDRGGRTIRQLAPVVLVRLTANGPTPLPDEALQRLRASPVAAQGPSTAVAVEPGNRHILEQAREVFKEMERREAKLEEAVAVQQEKLEEAMAVLQEELRKREETMAALLEELRNSRDSWAGQRFRTRCAFSKWLANGITRFAKERCWIARNKSRGWTA
ncbi:hypothetical protein DFJ73DRAFT_763494 [Zopfochytrium polystomum]|nr:hypothetical protein DFJ73DRAFT_763494 [Zopfochytrium polystomum]